MKARKLLCALMVLSLLFSLCGCNMTDYKKAEEAFAAEDYETALSAYEALGDYKDSADKAAVCRYRIALILEEQKEYETAASLFEELGSYEDAEKHLSDCRDRLLEQKVVGRWQTDSIDTTELFVDLLREQYEAMGDLESLKLLDCCEFKDLCMVYCLVLNENGTYSLYPEKASVDRYIENIIREMKAGMLEYYEQVFRQTCAEQGVTYDQLLEFYGASDIESLLAVLGLNIDDIVAAMKPMYESVIDEEKEEGKYHVQNGKLYIGNGEDKITTEYDSEKDELLCRRENLEDYYEDGKDSMPFKRSK